MPYYRHHLFFCTNRREDGSPCCQDFDATEAREYVKQKTKALGLHGKGQCRVNSAGCLDRCDEGPVIAVYPEGIWYTYVDHEDLDEIVEKHIKNGEIVDRLRLPDA